MTSKHTPGPWSVVSNPTSNYGLEVVADVKVKAKRIVCRVSGPDREANAKLIAAAPDLFAALQAIQWFCDDPNGSDSRETLADGLARLLPAARNAIALASS